MPPIQLRTMQPDDWNQVASLIYLSTNYWYQTHGRPPIFSGGPQVARIFCEVYEDIDPGCCIVAETKGTGMIAGSCFYHPRQTHVSMGIMNVHPNYFGMGVARQILTRIIEYATKAGQTLRLVSSAMNLDSYSLYTRAGFVPYATFQDMYITVPEEGLPAASRLPGCVRDAAPADIPAIVELEARIIGIRRNRDYAYFIENRRKIWHMSVYENGDGNIEGFAASVNHPGSHLIGPGLAPNQDIMEAVLLAELNAHRGSTPVFLLPVHCGQLIAKAYEWGARNCEMHVAQALGPVQPIAGVMMPTFMPETA